MLIDESNLIGVEFDKSNSYIFNFTGQGKTDSKPYEVDAFLGVGRNKSAVRSK